MFELGSETTTQLGETQPDSVGALRIRIGFGGILYENFNKEPPK